MTITNIKYPVVDKGITMVEIPNHMAVFITLGGCKQGCKGCHSSYLADDIHRDLWTSMKDIIAYAAMQQKRGANAVVIMGGTNNQGVYPSGLIALIKELSTLGMPVGLYSGLKDTANIHKALGKVAELQYLKTGEYKEALGGLDKETTNQKFFSRNPLKRDWKDMTYIFQLPPVEKKGQEEVRGDNWCPND